MVDKDLKTVTIEVGNPALDIASAGADVKERRREADASASSAVAPRRKRSTPLRRTGIDDTTHQRGVRHLQRAIVLPLIGKKEVAPAQAVEHSRFGQPFGCGGQVARERGEARSEAGTGRRKLGFVRVDHRECQPRTKEVAQITRVDGARACIRFARLLGLVALGQDPSEAEPLTARFMR